MLPPAIRHPSRLVWLALALGVVAIQVVTAIDISGRAAHRIAQAWESSPVRLPGIPSSPPAPPELIWVGAIALALAILCTIPAIAVLLLAARHIRIARRSVILAMLATAPAFAFAAGQISSRVSDAMGTPGSSSFGMTVVFGPTIEEIAKLVAVALVAGLGLRGRLGLHEGVVLGVGVGLAATILEVALYAQLSYAGGTNTAYGSLLAIRLGVFGINVHVVATALGGAGLGAWLGGGRHSLRPLVLGLAAAVGVHATWNLLGSDLVTAILLRLQPSPDFADTEPFALSALFAASSTANIIFLAAPTAGLYLAWRRSSRSGPHAGEGAYPPPPKVEASVPPPFPLERP